MAPCIVMFRGYHGYPWYNKHHVGRDG